LPKKFLWCPQVIAGECKSNVEWETPLGLPVVQPYTQVVGLQADRTLLSMDDTRLLSLGRRLRTRPTVPKINVLKHKVEALEP
jgi:hypothetical protein